MEEGPVHCRWCCPWTGGPCFYKKQDTQVMKIKPISSTSPCCLHQLLSPCSCPVWVPMLTSFDDEREYGSVSQIIPVLPKLLFCFMTAIVTPTKIVSVWISLSQGKVVFPDSLSLSLLQEARHMSTCWKWSTLLFHAAIWILLKLPLSPVLLGPLPVNLAPGVDSFH